jgi:glycosyltransferase involved in cell wall biosynthesis
MPRVCIISPGALGSNPRVVKEANTLQQDGWEVDVISTRTLEEVDARDADVLASANWRSHRIDLTDRLAWRARRLLQMAARGLFNVTRQATWAEHGYSAFSAPLKAMARRIPADLYIAHYPAALPAAVSAVARHGGQYAFDAEDFHLGDLPGGPASQGPNRLLQAIERRRLPGCAYMTAASSGIADAYEETYGIARPTVVLNVFPRAHAPATPSPAGTATPGPSIYWFSQVIGPDRGLECAIRALSMARSRPHLYLRGMPAVGYLDNLHTLAREAGVADRLHILRPAPPTEMERLAARYDLGYAGETGRTRNRRIALTNKQFTYLLAGVPTLLSDIPSHRQIAEEMGEAARLFATDNPASLAAVLDDILSDADQLARMRAVAFQLGQKRFNWDVEQAALLRCARGVLGGEKSVARTGSGAEGESPCVQP